MGKLIDKILSKIGDICSTLLLGNTKTEITETKKDVQYIRKETDDDIKPSLKKLREEFTAVDKTVEIMKEKVDRLWNKELALAHSPLQLKPKGVKVLNESGIKKIIDDRIDDLYKKVKDKNPRNAYWVQEYSESTIYKLRQDKLLLPVLETSAYEAGIDIDAILFVGGVYLRDLILPKFDFTPEDIDNCEESKKLANN